MPATYTLTTGVDTVNGDSGVNTVVAASDTLSAGDQISAGSGSSNALNLTGTGTFDLSLPTTLTGIAVVNVTEFAGFAFQTVTMRSGLNVTVNVTSAANGGVTIFGANDSDVFNLGGGADIVTLGSASEVVNGGGGPALVNITAATAGARITGHGNTTTLGISGGGTITLNAADVGITLIKLAASTTAYTLATTTEANQVVTDNSTTADTVVLNSASDVLFAKAASVTAKVTAANAGVLIYGGTGNSVLEITTGGTAVLNPATIKVRVVLDAATQLTLNSNITGVIGSSGNDTVTLGAANLKLTAYLDAGAGSNTLVLSGAGAFKLAQPAVLANFQTIDTYEGAGQTVTMRAGMAVVVNVEGATTSGTSNAITLTGAVDRAVFNLGAGTDTVNLGSSNEVVNGGTGTAVINAKATTAGALIHGGAATKSLTISGGGTAVLNAADSGIATVTLATTSTAYTLTTNAETGLTVNDQGLGADAITLGGANETVTGGAHGKLTVTCANAGYDTFVEASATINGDRITNFQRIGNLIDVTDFNFSKVAGTLAENATGTMAQLTLNDGTHAFAIALNGHYLANGTSGSLAAAGLVLAADGQGGMDIEYAGTTAVTLNGSTGNRVVIANSVGDTLIGGAGDTLVGGAGADTFVLHAGFGKETVTNFAATGTSNDVLQLDKTAFADWAHLLGATKQQGSDLVITLDSSDIITLKNVTLANFTSTDARFV